jgi:hypothetical protein
MFRKILVFVGKESLEDKNSVSECLRFRIRRYVAAAAHKFSTSIEY